MKSLTVSNFSNNWSEGKLSLQFAIFVFVYSISRLKRNFLILRSDRSTKIKNQNEIQYIIEHPSHESCPITLFRIFTIRYEICGITASKEATAQSHLTYPKSRIVTVGCVIQKVSKCVLEIVGYNWPPITSTILENQKSIVKGNQKRLSMMVNYNRPWGVLTFI